MSELTSLPPCPFCDELYGENHKDNCYISLMRENLVALLSGWEHAPIPSEELQKAWNTRYERIINLKDAVDEIAGDVCGDGYDAKSRAENIVEAIARMCGARVINE